MSEDEIKLEYYMSLKNSKTIDINETLTQQLAKEMAETHKKLVNNLDMPVVSDSFSSDKLKEAYSDGFSDSRFDFDAENYR